MRSIDPCHVAKYLLFVSLSFISFSLQLSAAIEQPKNLTNPMRFTVAKEVLTTEETYVQNIQVRGHAAIIIILVVVLVVVAFCAT